MPTMALNESPITALEILRWNQAKALRVWDEVTGGVIPIV